MEWRLQWSVLNPAGHCFRWFLILGSFGSGFFSFFLSCIRSLLLLLHSNCSLSDTQQEPISANANYGALPKWSTCHAFPWLYTSSRAPSWLRIQSKHHSKASSLRSRILTYPQSCLPPSACIHDSMLWSSCSMSVNMPFPPSSKYLLYQYLHVSFFSYLNIQAKYLLLSEILTGTSFTPGRISFCLLWS